VLFVSVNTPWGWYVPDSDDGDRDVVVMLLSCHRWVVMVDMVVSGLSWSSVLVTGGGTAYLVSTTPSPLPLLLLLWVVVVVVVKDSGKGKGLLRTFEVL